MNYPEQILRQSIVLWQERERSWRQKLSAIAGAKIEKGDNGTEKKLVGEKSAVERLAKKLLSEDAAAEFGAEGLPWEEESAKEKSGTGSTERGENIPARETYSGSSAEQMSTMERGGTELLRAESGTMEVKAKRRAVRSPDDTGMDRSGNGAAWLAGVLSAGTTEGVLNVQMQRQYTELLPNDETTDLQKFSQTVERDARRYDGGFLLY